MKYAIYSEKQAAMAGTAEYTTPDGGTVIVTHVSDKPGCPTCLWDDKIDMGEVVKYVRTVSEGDLPRFSKYKLYI